MSYEPYMDKTYYTDTFKGTVIPESEIEKYLRQASRHIDTLTYNRIVGQGFLNLTVFQQEIVQEVCSMQAEFEYQNKEIFDMILQGYSINGVRERRQNLRGCYEDLDLSKLLPGELAFVTSGDPNSSSGRSVYACFEAGIAKRFTTYEDFETEIQNATEEIQATFTEEIRNAANAAITATEAANKAVESAQAATEAANKAAEAAGAYVLGDLSNNVVTFDMASEKALPASGENMATLFGKVTKYLSDLVSGAISNVIGVNLVANRALVSDANGKIGAAEVTATELGYLSGVTSKVQTQFDELNTKITDGFTLHKGTQNKGYMSMEYGDHTVLPAKDSSVPNVPVTSNFIYFVFEHDNVIKYALAFGTDYTQNCYVYTAYDNTWRQI